MRRCSALFLAVTLAFAGGSCAKHHPAAPVVPAPQAPAATSPEGAVRRLAWGWANRDTAVVLSVLTDDFAFVFAPNDSAGNAWPGRCWSRAVEGLASTRLFLGGASEPPAQTIALTIDNTLVALADPRQGMAPKWHRSIRTHVLLNVTVDRNGSPDVCTVQGYALFYLVRGDSAALSPARVAAGGRDSTLWYISRWEDETAGASSLPARVLPARSYSWGWVKAGYVDPPPPAAGPPARPAR